MAIKCPDCGTYNLTSAEVCKKCGASLGPTLSETPKTTTSAPKLPFIKRIVPHRSQAKKG
ncbi:MAG TPA: hypothetical protein GXX51_04705 [Firmicutes bacterium]|nr:hypothetical protein [Bacillota bacterium]